MRTRSRTMILLCTICCVLFSVFSISYSYSRYVGDLNRDSAVRASDFYFSSDLLSTAGSSYHIASNVPFVVSLKNFKDSLNFMSNSISFTVSVSGGTVSGGAPENGVYLISGGSARTLTLTISPTASTISVTVVAVSPYTKTLSATFSLSESSADSSYSLTAVTSTSTYLEIVLVIGSTVPTVTVSWNTSMFAHDNTNNCLANATENAGVGSAVLTNLAPNMIYNILFFVVGTGTCNAVPDTAISSSTVNIVLPTLA